MLVFLDVVLKAFYTFSIQGSMTVIRQFVNNLRGLSSSLRLKREDLMMVRCGMKQNEWDTINDGPSIVPATMIGFEMSSMKVERK